MSAQREQGGGLSIQTLVIASLASMTAAVVIHEIWTGGAILGAAITPIIVAITSEVLKRPINRAAELRERGLRTTRSHEAVARGETAPIAPPAAEETWERPAARSDPFGIWEAERRQPWYRRLDRRHLRLALATGVLAFVVGAVALTAAELVLGGNVGSGGGGTTLGGGTDRERERGQDERRQTTTTPATTPTAPAGEADPPAGDPAQTTPPAQTAPPAATTPPPATTPAPAPGEQQPAPAPEGGTPPPAPAPAPAPAPG